MTKATPKTTNIKSIIEGESNNNEEEEEVLAPSRIIHPNHHPQQHQQPQYHAPAIPYAIWPDNAPHADEQHVMMVIATEAQYRWAVYERCNEDFFPSVYWRTAAISVDDIHDTVTPSALMARFFPAQAMELIYGKESTSAVGSSNGNTGTWSNNTDAENVAVAAAYRATLRIPCVTVYCILPASATNRCSPSDDNTNTNDTTTEEEDCLSLDTFRDSSYVLKDDKTEIGAANFAGRRLLFLLKKSFPCHLIQLRPQDFWPSSEQEPGPDNNVNYTIPNPHCYGTEQMATVASVEMLFASRHTLVLDGGMPALTMTMLAPNNNNTENSNDNNKKMKMEDDEEKRGEKVAAHDTAAPRAKRSIRIVGDARTVSVCTKLQRLHEATGALPLISTAQVLEALSCLQNRNDSLPMFATNTTNAMLGAVLHETILIVRAAIKEWAESVFNFQTTSTISLAKSYPLVCITGIEGDILMKLLTSGLVEMEPDPDFIWRADNPNIEENAPALLQVRLSSSGPMMDIEVKKHRHMSFNGLPQMLMKYGNLRKETMTEVEKLRQEVLGCRVAKDFGPQQGGIYFGQVVSINRTRPETIDEDLVRVRFDDGDEEDYSVTQLYDLLLLFCKQFDHLSIVDVAKVESKIRLSSRVADMLAHASDVVKEEITGRAVNEVVLETAANLFEVFDDDPLPSIQKESVCNDLQSSAVMGAKSEAEPEPITRKQVREWVMDRRIAKDFGSGLGVFLGRVVNVYDVTSKTLDKALFRVLYTDGDKEDLNAVELYDNLLLYCETTVNQSNGNKIMENHQKESLRTAKLLASVNNEVQRHVEQQSGQERLESVQHTLTARRERGETNSKRSHAKIEE